MMVVSTDYKTHKFAIFNLYTLRIFTSHLPHIIHSSNILSNPLLNTPDPPDVHLYAGNFLVPETESFSISLPNNAHT